MSEGMKWIIASKEIPPRGKTVLIATLARYTNAPWAWTIVTGHWCGEGWGWDTGDNRGLCDVYAWSELPKPPEMPQDKKSKQRRADAMKAHEHNTEFDRELANLKQKYGRR